MAHDETDITKPMMPAKPAVAERLQANGRKMESALRAIGFDFATNIINGNLDERYPQNAGVHNLDWLVSGALDFIDRNKDKPFFLYFASSVAHSPNPAQALVERRPARHALRLPGDSAGGVATPQHAAKKNPGVRRHWRTSAGECALARRCRRRTDETA